MNPVRKILISAVLDCLKVINLLIRLSNGVNAKYQPLPILEEDNFPFKT